VLLAQELALVALKPETGRFRIGMTSDLNACLAGLLVGELMVVGAAGPGEKDGRVVVTAGAPLPPVLAAVAEVVATKGPKLRAVLSHMSRGLEHRLGTSTLDTVREGLAGAGIIGPAAGGRRPHRGLIAAPARDQVLARLRAAAAADGPLEPRTALVLNMTGPAKLLEIVAPDRPSRGHARKRIDHALDGTPLAPVGTVVRKLIEDRNAAAAGAA
jgi:hypothetical protein